MERVDGYMKRAEDLKNVLEGLNSQAKGGKHRFVCRETIHFDIICQKIEKIKYYYLDIKKTNFDNKKLMSRNDTIHCCYHSTFIMVMNFLLDIIITSST